MTVKLNHTIVSAPDPRVSANFLVDILGLAPPVPFGPFLTVALANDITLDYAEADGEVHPQHYAFLVSEPEFDEIFARITRRGLQYWADPSTDRPGEINTRDGGRGLYFMDPGGHYLEILTRPYGSGAPGT